MTTRTRFVFVAAVCPTITDGEATYNRFIRFKNLEDCTYKNIIKILKENLFRYVTISNIVFFNESDFNRFSNDCEIIEA